jgi:hypothetical protein
MCPTQGQFAWLRNTGDCIPRLRGADSCLRARDHEPITSTRTGSAAAVPVRDPNRTRELEDALDAWLADDRIDEDREHVLSWMREDRELDARRSLGGSGGLEKVS